MNVNNVSAKKAQTPQPARPAHKTEASLNLQVVAGVVSPSAKPANEILTRKPTPLKDLQQQMDTDKIVHEQLEFTFTPLIR